MKKQFILCLMVLSAISINSGNLFTHPEEISTNNSTPVHSIQSEDPGDPGPK